MYLFADSFPELFRLGLADSTSASTTFDFGTVVNYSSYKIVEAEGKKVIEVVATAAKEDDVKVRFKGENVFISIKGNDYISAVDLTLFLGFAPKKDLIKVYLEAGILTIEVGIPEDYEFEVNLGGE